MQNDICHFKSWHDILKENSQKYKEKIFIESIDQNKNITFAEMYEWSNKISNLLEKLELKKSDKVTLIGKNSIETIILYFGILNYGAILNPIFFEESDENLFRIVNLTKPSLVFYDSDRSLAKAGKETAIWMSFPDFFKTCDSDNQFIKIINNQSDKFENCRGNSKDIAEILYTSGTTTVPKGILISREALFLMADEISERIGLTDNDRVLEYRAYSWASAQLLTILSSMLKGNTLFLGKKFSISRFSTWLKDYDITISAGVPAVLNMMINGSVNLNKKDVPSLRFITSSSAPLPEETHRRFEEMYGIKINQMMGMSEAGWMAGNPPSNQRFGSVGLPLKYKKIHFIKNDGTKCCNCENGEMVVAGKSIGMGYLGEDGSLVAFPNEGFATGDLGYADDDGYIFITGRAKDLIIRGGINISPLEISSRIMEHPAVNEAIIIGVPDNIYGEEVVGFVTQKDGFRISENELIDHCKACLPDFKIPKKFYFLSSLPRNQNGKVVKSELIKVIDT